MQFVTVSVNYADLPLAEALPRIAGEGAGPRVEIWAGNPAHFRPWDPHDVAAARAALDASGLCAFSLHAPFNGPDDNLSHPDEGHRDHALQRHVECIEAAAALGAEVLVVHPGVRLPESPDIPALVARSSANLRKLADLAEARGVCLAVESLPPTYLGGHVEELVEIVDAVASNAVGVCLDTGHCNLSGDVGGWVRATVGRVISIHLHDNDGTDDQHRPPGEGTINWPAVALALRDIGYRAPITLETRPDPAWPWARLASRAVALLDHS